MTKLRWLLVLTAVASLSIIGWSSGFTLSNGLSIDPSGNILINASGGTANIVTSSGFPLDSSGNLLVNCTVGCAATSHNVSAALVCAAASGSGTTYTCSTSPTFVPADHDLIILEADVTSTGPATLVVNGQAGTPAIQKWGASATAIALNDLRLSGDYLLEFDGANWQVLSTTGSALSVPLGGTGFASCAAGGIAVGNSATALACLATINLNATGNVSKMTGLSTTGNGVVGVFASSGAVTIGSGASLASTSLCSTAQCPAGRYRVDVYIDVTTACTTTGSYIPWLGYTDDAGAKVGSSTTTYFSSGGGLGVTPATASTGLTLVPIATTDSLTASYFLTTTGAATNSQGSINYGTTASACGTGGPMVGKMYFDVTRLE